MELSCKQDNCGHLTSNSSHFTFSKSLHFLIETFLLMRHYFFPVLILPSSSPSLFVLSLVLLPFLCSETHGEVCCLAVHPSYRREGRGETLLAYLERRYVPLLRII